MLLTREYSFKWNRTQITPRQERLPQLLGIIGKLTGIHFVGENSVEGRTSVRKEYGFVDFLSACGISGPDTAIARFRDYLVGEKAGTRTFDIKTNYRPPIGGVEQEGIKKIASHPFQVAKDFRKSLEIDKLEEGANSS